MMAGGAVGVKDDSGSEPLSAPAMAIRWGRGGDAGGAVGAKGESGRSQGWPPGRWLWTAPARGCCLDGWGWSATGEREGRFFPDGPGVGGPGGGAVAAARDLAGGPGRRQG